ncbi:Uncharacterised protein [Mycobacteroides abscessus subsp. abscessus]|nr:Uncharacterised protein [Mycobacteroides abscessus subsp. abscessus]
MHGPKVIGSGGRLTIRTMLRHIRSISSQMCAPSSWWATTDAWLRSHMAILALLDSRGTSSPRVSHMSRMVVDSAFSIRSSSSLARPLTRPSARACHSAAWCLSRWSLGVGVVSLSRGNGSTWLTSVSSPCSTSRRSPLRAPSPRFACPTAVSVSRSIHQGRSARRLRSSTMQALHTNRSVARSHRLHLVNG